MDDKTISDIRARMEGNRKIIIVGGGAAGFFSAITAARKNPEARVSIFEKSSKLLTKVSISGGGRCNVTHDCQDPDKLIAFYPRGSKELLGPFHRFSPAQTIEWFRECGIALKTEADGRMFPVTDNSSTIVNCLLSEARSAGVEIETGMKVKKLIPIDTGQIRIRIEDKEDCIADAVLIATGGNASLSAFIWLEELGHHILTPVPSLFTFNIPSHPITALMGLSVSDVLVKIAGTKFSQQGPLLITHWGMSGPAVLKLSSVAARALAEKNYQFDILINWSGDSQLEELKEKIQILRKNNPSKAIIHSPLTGVPKRLWEYLVGKAGITNTVLWADLSAKKLQELSQILYSDQYHVSGKTTFKEEFVTCGGVSLKEVDFKTMQSKIVPNLYFAGEVLDIDALTGGFNFQAAWTTGFIAGESMAYDRS